MPPDRYLKGNVPLAVNEDAPDNFYIWMANSTTDPSHYIAFFNMSPYSVKYVSKPNSKMLKLDLLRHSSFHLYLDIQRVVGEIYG